MDGIVAFALKQRVLMVVVFVMTMIGGVFAFMQLNIEAYPDPVPPLVDVITLVVLGVAVLVSGFTLDLSAR